MFFQLEGNRIAVFLSTGIDPIIFSPGRHPLWYLLAASSRSCERRKEVIALR